MEIGLLSLSDLGIFVLLAIIVIMFYLKCVKSSPKDGFPVSSIENDILSELKKLRQDLESKPQTTSDMHGLLDELRKLREEVESRFQDLTRANAPSEVEKLRQEIESRFNIRFDNGVFTENDVYSFLFTVSNALYRFDRETGSREGNENLLTEARGYIAILNLAMAWARANGNDAVRKKLSELFPRAEAAFKRMNQL